MHEFYILSVEDWHKLEALVADPDHLDEAKALADKAEKAAESELKQVQGRVSIMFDNKVFVRGDKEDADV